MRISSFYKWNSKDWKSFNVVNTNVNISCCPAEGMPF